MKRKGDKLFILRKYVKARSVQEAIRLSKNAEWDDVYVSDDWKEGTVNQLASAIGFETYPPNEEE